MLKNKIKVWAFLLIDLNGFNFSRISHFSAHLHFPNKQGHQGNSKALHDALFNWFAEASCYIELKDHMLYQRVSKYPCLK